MYLSYEFFTIFLTNKTTKIMSTKIENQDGLDMILDIYNTPADVAQYCDELIRMLSYEDADCISDNFAKCYRLLSSLRNGFNQMAIDNGVTPYAPAFSNYGNDD